MNGLTEEHNRGKMMVKSEVPSSLLESYLWCGIFYKYCIDFETKGYILQILPFSNETIAIKHLLKTNIQTKNVLKEKRQAFKGYNLDQEKSVFLDGIFSHKEPFALFR